MRIVAAVDGDFSGFTDADGTTWKEKKTVVQRCVPLDASGNYVLPQDQRAALQQYQQDVRGPSAPVGPCRRRRATRTAGCASRCPPEAAVAASRVTLPAVSWPAEDHPRVSACLCVRTRAYFF